jgi:TPR repeat protein
MTKKQKNEWQMNLLLNVANRIELLFLMVKGHESHFGELALRLLSQNKAGEPAVAAAAEDGLLVAQLMLGVAYLEGRGVEKDERAAYRWLRMAELNSSTVLTESRCGLKVLKSRLQSQEIKELERQVVEKTQEQLKQARAEPAVLTSIYKAAS